MTKKEYNNYKEKLKERGYKFVGSRYDERCYYLLNICLLYPFLYYIYCIYQIFILTLPQRYNKR